MCSAQWLPPHSLSPLKSHSGVLIQGLFVLFNNKFLILFLNCHRLVSNITAIRWVRKTRRQSKALASVTLLSPRWLLSRFILHTWHSWQKGRKVIIWRDIEVSLGTWRPGMSPLMKGIRVERKSHQKSSSNIIKSCLQKTSRRSYRRF